MNIEGFEREPRTRADGTPYPGRFICPGVQWTRTGGDILATFTVTAREIADAAESRLLWTDQDVQRGIKPGLPYSVPRELPLADGYPDGASYVFNAANSDDIVSKLLNGERLFLNPLVWNLRPGSFTAYWNEENGEVWLYKGMIYLPDSHHRQQAILKAIRIYDEEPEIHPLFSPEEQFKVELYFLTREDEGNYFFDKNQRPRPTSKSKAYDLTTLDDLSLLAKSVIERSKALKGNVNRVTDRLTRTNPQVVTLSTLRQMMKLVAPAETLDKTEMEGIAEAAATFYDLLAEARPELGKISREERQAVRDTMLVDSGVVMFGYAYLIRAFRDEVPQQGLNWAVGAWRKRLGRLSETYSFRGWSGDLFSRENPLWREIGVLRPQADSDRLTISNTGATRAECGRVLRQLMTLKEIPSDLVFLVSR